MAATPKREDWFNHETLEQLSCLTTARDFPSADMLRAMLIASGTGVFFYPMTLDAQGNIVVSELDAGKGWALNIESLMCVDAGSLSMDGLFKRVHTDDQEVLQQQLHEAIARGDSECDGVCRICCSNGDIRWLQTRYLFGWDAAKRLQYIAGVCFDITARKKLEEQLRHSNEQLEKAQGYLKTALKASGIAIFRHPLTWHREFKSANHDLNTWNYNIAEMYGHPDGTVMTPDLMLRQIEPQAIETIRSKTQEFFSGGSHEWELEYKITILDGTPKWLLMKALAECDQNGVPEFISGAVIDITERKSADDRIRHIATHDGLTDLPNRMMFGNLLNHTIDVAKRYSRKFALLFIDLDRFKAINDAFGHQAGDALLQEIAQRLKRCTRASDVVARLSGDEFVVLIQEVDEASEAGICARKIITEVMKPITLQSQECRVTASVGIALFPENGDDEQTLMKNADTAMYQAKEEGKNNFQFYNPNTNSHTLQRMVLENHLRGALENNELQLQYQAKLDLRSNRISGVEALLRWNNPEVGFVSPAQFIPIAEETGLIVPIGRWVLKTACMQNMAWQAQGLPPVCMAVNLSPRQFLNQDLLAHIHEALDESGLPPELLELEITESMVMHHVDQAVQLLHAIKQIGVRIAIDDFGTGYSSLAQLKRFPIDTLKVDRSFIREVVQDSDDQAITEAIIAMGKSLSLTIVAEGVETREQQDFLRNRACDEMQGFYFSRPVVPEEFAELLGKHVAVQEG
jgi:diguanylate cyclase (GGDEF)-like protein